MPVSEFDFNALGDYITSSKDMVLREKARKYGKKYIGSSSSMTHVLSHFHYLLSAWRPLNMESLSQGFPEKSRTTTRLSKSPAAVFLRYQDGVYAIDADKEFDTSNILMNLGKSMEKLLTMPTEQYERYRRTNGNRIPPGEADPETYHYSTCGDFLMRAQLDAYDPRLPGTGMFDLKTRAVVSIRMDAENPDRGVGYEIRDRFGNFESFEREYFDMARSAFLKYSLQVRVGRMDGIFVAYHNTQRIFGFQYLPLSEMDKVLHGQEDRSLGDAEFVHSITLWNRVLDKATAQFPEQSLRFHIETRPGVIPFMYIFAEPVTDEEINEIQTKNQEKIEAIEKRLLYPELCEEEDAAAADAKNNESDEADMRTESEPEPELEPHLEQEPQTHPQPPQSASEILAQHETANSQDPNTTTTTDGDAEEPERPVFGMMLYTIHKVNGQQVTRPTKLTPHDQWEVDYKLVNLAPSRAHSLLKACQTRRAKSLEADDDAWRDAYRQRLYDLSQRGRQWRQAEDELDRELGVVMYEERK